MVEDKASSSIIGAAIIAVTAIASAVMMEALHVIFFQRRTLTSSLSDAADGLSDGVSLGIKNPVNDDAGVTGMI